MEMNLFGPRFVEIGGGAVLRIVDVLRRFGLSRPMIVTDPALVRMGLTRRIMAPLDAAGIPYAVFGEAEPEPLDTMIEEGVAFVRGQERQPDCLIGFGGGTALDAAKAINILLTAKPGTKMREYKVPAVTDRAALPLIAVPTTGGTGSEVTRFTVVTDTETEEKMVITGLAVVPLASIVDYELTLSVPQRVTADTGIDAFTHALEAFVSKRATPLSDAYAKAAIPLIGANLRTACHDPENRPAREAMALGAMLAGLAFSNASVALVHGMSRPIGAHFHVPHGMSNAMLLPAVTRYSLQAALPRYAEAARLAGFAAAEDADQVAGQKLLETLDGLNLELDVPTPAQFGIERAVWDGRLAVMAEQALASGSPANNPAVPDAAEIIQLYGQMYG